MVEWSRVYNLQTRWAHWCDLVLAQSWLDYALSLVTDAEETRLDQLGSWTEQQARIAEVWRAWGMVYRGLNVRPWNERIYRTWWELTQRSFFQAEGGGPPWPMHPEANAHAISGAYAQVIRDWFRANGVRELYTEAEWAVGSYPHQQHYVEGYNLTRPYPVLCDLGLRVMLDELGLSITENGYGICLPKTCPTNLMKDFNREQEFVPPGEETPLRRNRPAGYDWRWIEWRENSPWGVGSTRGCPVGPVSPPALWFFKAAQAGIREMASLGLYTVLDHTFSDVTLRNLLTADNLGLLPDALIDLAAQAKAGIHQHGSADDQVMVIAYTAQAAGALIAAVGGPFGAIAGALVSAIGALAPYIAEAAIPRLSSDVFGRSSPTFEEVDISYSLDDQARPTHSVLDPPDFRRSKYTVVETNTSGGETVVLASTLDPSRATSTGRFTTPGVANRGGLAGAIQRVPEFPKAKADAIQKAAQDAADAVANQGLAKGGASGLAASPEPPFYARPVFYIPVGLATAAALG